MPKPILLKDAKYFQEPENANDLAILEQADIFSSTALADSIISWRNASKTGIPLKITPNNFRYYVSDLLHGMPAPDYVQQLMKGFIRFKAGEVATLNKKAEEALPGNVPGNGLSLKDCTP